MTHAMLKTRRSFSKCARGLQPRTEFLKAWFESAPNMGDCISIPFHRGSDLGRPIAATHRENCQTRFVHARLQQPAPTGRQMLAGARTRSKHAPIASVVQVSLSPRCPAAELLFEAAGVLIRGAFSPRP